MSIKLQPLSLTDLKPRIVVIGVGGAGGNAINNMIATGLDGVTFVVANTDAQALQASSAEHVIQLGRHVTEGLGAGSRPEIGEAAAEEAVEEIRAHVSGAHMVFIAAGMGGGTGTGAAAVIARVAQEEKALAVGIVTKPFQFEGARRMRIAEAGIAEVKKHVDTLIVIPNQNLFRLATEKTTFAEAFVLADQVLYSGIACIVDVIVKEGLINLDFADVRTILTDMGNAMMGMGEAEGDRRAIEAAEEAIANPLLDDVSLRGAKGLLISITGGRDMTLYEIDEAASRIRQEVDADANIILGATFDETLENRVRVSIVASGLASTIADGRTGAATAPPVPRTAPPPPSLADGARADMSHETAGTSSRAASVPSDLDPIELRQRLSEAFGHGDTEGPEAVEAEDGALVFDSNSTIAGEPWRAPGDVLIEEGLPHLAQQPAVRPHRDAPLPPPIPPSAGAPNFAPQPPHEIRRSTRRPTEPDAFPAAGSREARGRAEGASSSTRGHGPTPPAIPAGSAARPATQAAHEAPDGAARKPGLFERLTGRTKRGDSLDDGAATPSGNRSEGGSEERSSDAGEPSIGRAQRVSSNRVEFNRKAR